MRDKFSPRICATVASSKMKDARRMAGSALAQGADLVEIRFDFLEELPEPDEASWCRELGLPAIATVRPLGEGGRYRGSEKERLRLLADLAGTCQYVDLELPSANVELIGRMKKSGARVILSHHDFTHTPAQDELLSLTCRGRAMGGDVMKIATMTNSLGDVLRLLELPQSVPSTVVVPMGEVGRIGRLLAPIFGSEFTYAVPDGMEPVAPGMLSVRNMRRLYGSLAGTIDQRWSR